MRTSLASLVVLVACGEPSDRACMRGAERPCDIRDAPCRQTYTEATACLLGVTDYEPPRFRVLTSEQYEAEVAADFERPEAQALLAILDDWARGLALLDLADATASDALFAIDTTTVPAFYDHHDDTITILADYAGEDRAARSLFLHEMTHALQDQRFDLGSWLDEHAHDSEQWLAALTLVEGEATLTQLREQVAMDRFEVEQIDWARYFGEWQAEAYAAVSDSDDPFFMTPRWFPYAWGAEHMVAAHLAGGQPDVVALFEHGPRASAPYLFPDGTDPVPTFGPYVGLAPPRDGYRLFDEDVLGAWHIGVVARRRGTQVSSFPPVLTGWRSDLMSTWRGQDEAIAVVWRIATADPDTAAFVASWVEDDAVLVHREGTIVYAAASTVPGDAAIWLDWALSARPLPAVQPVAARRRIADRLH